MLLINDRDILTEGFMILRKPTFYNTILKEDNWYIILTIFNTIQYSSNSLSRNPWVLSYYLLIQSLK